MAGLNVGITLTVLFLVRFRTSRNYKRATRPAYTLFIYLASPLALAGTLQQPSSIITGPFLTPPVSTFPVGGYWSARKQTHAPY